MTWWPTEGKPPDFWAFRLDNDNQMFAVIFPDGSMYVVNYETVLDMIRKANTWVLNRDG